MVNMSRDDKVRAVASPWRGGVEIAAFRRLPGGVTHALCAEWRTCNDTGAPLESLLSLTMEQAQVLMDDLWDSGVRPTEGAGSAGAMKAAQSHIADLRRVAFKALGIEG
jgi:hypothetical protein